MRHFVDFRSERSMFKFYLFLIACLLFSIHCNAQYSFSALKGTFTPLTDSKPVSSIQKYSSISGTIDIGFTYKFNGHPYDRLKASASGFITFKKYATWDGMDSSVIAPLGFNALSGEKGNASYKTEETAPNRVFTFEWLNWKWDWDAAQPGISFQVKLYETTNRIEFIYQQEAGELNKPFARIGLMFQQPGKSIFLSDAGENPKAYSNVSYYVYQKPATGQIYRFDEIIRSEPAGHVTNFVNSRSGGISLKWSDSRGERLPERYLILVSDKSFEDIKLPVDGTEQDKDLNLKDGDGTVYVDYGVQNFTEFTELKVNSTYFIKIFPVTNYFTYANYNTDGNVPQLEVNTSIDLSTIEVDIAEAVLKNTSSDIQFSIISTDGTNGAWIDCDPVKTMVDFKTGGFNLWVRQKSNNSNNLLLLSVPPQSNAPSFTIDFTKITTFENIPVNVEYSYNQAMSSSIVGSDLPVSLVPGTTIYFRKKATKTEVASAVQTLVVPARPGAPAISIDFASEKTKERISADVEFSYSIEMVNPASGSGDFVTITPAQTIYFRTKTDAASFSSEILTLSVPVRPSAPNFSIDYLSEKTAQVVGSEVEYSWSSNMANSVEGNGTGVELTPGGNIYFRFKATPSSFKSDVREIKIPLRPAAPANLRVDDQLNIFDWDFIIGFNSFSDYEYSIDTGNIWKACTAKPMSIGNINVKKGAMLLRVKSTQSSFKGEFVASDEEFTVSTGVPSLEDGEIKYYPNPSKRTLLLENIPENSTVSIFSFSGTMVFQKKSEGTTMNIPVSDLSHGLFLIKIKTPKGEYQSKFIKQ